MTAIWPSFFCITTILSHLYGIIAIHEHQT